MAYALNLAEDGRILSAAVVLPNGKYDGMPIVDSFPGGDLYEYRYVEGEYIHDPLPAPEQPEAQPTQEERITALEQALTAIEEGIASV